MAQRLVRVICPECKAPHRSTPGELAILGVEGPDAEVYRGAGCSYCLETGYHGRTGVFELLLVDDEIRELITQRAGANLVKQRAVASGMRTLRDDGARKVLSGRTTVEEVLRVTQDDVVQYVE